VGQDFSPAQRVESPVPSSASQPPAGPLAGVTVLDLTRVLSGPYCTMLLADMGARVIKIEHPDNGDDTRAWGPPFINGESTYFLSINRNKESVAADFKRPDGRRVLDALIARADVLVENFRPGVLARLGLDYASMAAAHPRLIYASLSGYGQNGPRAAEPGYDAVLQGEGGLMSITGAADGPPCRLGVAVVDIVTGMFAAQGILLALLSRHTTGKGQHVDVSMLDSVAALLTYQAGIVFAEGQSPGRMGNRHPSIAPYDTFETADGPLVLAIGNDDQWQRFCRVAELDGLAHDSRFATNETRVQNYPALEPLLNPVIRRRTRAEWTKILVPAGVPCGPVKSVAEALADPQLRVREMLAHATHATAGDLTLLGVPIKLSATPGSVRTAPPTLGQHTRAVLAELGIENAKGGEGA
jgi:crotonobetainyl-CoA:carnitine CoA-transferase CaiB-like acyl-CoA transferase